MAGVTISVSGVDIVTNARAEEIERMRDLTEPNRNFGLRLRDKAIERLGNRSIRDRLTTNTLGRSILTTNDQQRGVVGTNLKYARVQQSGHPNLRPSTKKALAIPNPKNMALRRSGMWPSDFPRDTFVYRASKKPGESAGVLLWAFTVDRFGKQKDSTRRKGAMGSKAGDVAFFLRKKVVIPARPYLLVETVDIEFYAGQIRRHIRG